VRGLKFFCFNGILFRVPVFGIEHVGKPLPIELLLRVYNIAHTPQIEDALKLHSVFEFCRLVSYL